MRRLLLIAALGLGATLFAPAADACDTHHCIAAICGSEDHCGPVQRCYYWTDYPTCIYP